METSPSGKTPNFYPIANLSMFSKLLDEQLENDLEQLATLKQAEDRPHILDNATVTRIINLYTDAADLIWYYEQQLHRWRQGKLTEQQSREISRLDQQVADLDQCHRDILELCDRFQDNTIEQLLGKSDLELAMDMLSGKVRPPF